MRKQKITACLLFVVMLVSLFAVQCFAVENTAAVVPKGAQDSVKVVYEEKETPEIEEGEVAFTPKVKCVLKGELPSDLKEVFEVNIVTATEAQALIASEKVEMNKEIEFAPFTYKLPDTFKYVILQKEGTAKNITYDKTRYLITVVVEGTDVDDLKCLYSISDYDTGKKVDSIEFKNVYGEGSPDTSDNSNVGFWLLVIALGIICITGIAIVYIRDKSKDIDKK